MRNSEKSLLDITAFFNAPSTPDNTAEFFKQGFPEILLKGDHFINLLKRKSISDKPGTLLIINHARDFLPHLIQTQRDFRIFFYSLNEEILVHLFSQAPFIQERFLYSLPLFLKLLRETKTHDDDHLFLVRYYQTHFVSLLENNLTIGALSTLLFCFNCYTSKYDTMISLIFQSIKTKVLQLLNQPDFTPLILFCLSQLTEGEFTLLIQHIPECVDALLRLPIKPKIFANLIQFNKLMPSVCDHIHLLLFQDLIAQAQQPTYPVFAFFAFTPAEHDRVVIKKMNGILSDSENDPSEKVQKISTLIADNVSSLSEGLRKMLMERQLISERANAHAAAMG